MPNALLISEEAAELRALFRSSGYGLESQDPRQLLNNGAKAPAPRKCDLVFLDLDTEGWERQLLDLRQHVPVIAFSRPDIGKAVQALKLGATDYLEKPLSGDALAGCAGIRKPDAPVQALGEIIGTSPRMQEVFELIRRAALSESNVLITGESGTGKELVARAIHRLSPRRERAFMTINCSAIPDTLLESELFGFEKGAFTGANYTKKGMLEIATDGTAFFDEVGDVSALFQTKILRVIQEGEIMRIGGIQHVKVDVRVIAATHRDLKAACRKGDFREDLFYRLNVINIHLPPLKERMVDVPLLAGSFIGKHAPKRKDILVRGITDDALQVLMGYTFPGNVRELENIIEHAISFATYLDILPSDLPAYLHQAQPRRRTATPRMKEALASFERELIWSALQESRGNISKAAAALGIYRQELQRKIKKLKIAT